MKAKKALRITALVLAGLTLTVLGGPFLVPVPPLEGTVPPEQLGDPDSRFIELNGVKVHVKIAGEGEPALVLLHGFAASTYSWQAVMPALAESRQVIAYDRTGFGLTERPMPGDWTGESPYSPEAYVAQLLALLDRQGIDRAVLAGNSAGGTVATAFALAHPERVQALVLVDAAIYSGGGAPAIVRPLLGTPQMRHLGPLIARTIRDRGPELIELAWHDPGRMSPAVLPGYTKPLQAENWDRALWEVTVASRESGLAGRLTELKLPVLVITGDDDRIVPTAQSLQLARDIPGAQLVVIPECGHVPQEERPTEFLEAVEDFLAQLP